MPADYGGESAGAASLRSRSWTAWDLSLLAIAASVAAGLGELLARVALRGISSHIDRSFYLDPQAVWMAPAANLPLFGAAIAVTALVARAGERRAYWAVAVAVALGVLEFTLITRRIAPVALIVLAAGTGVAAARLSRRWGDMIRRRLPMLAGLLVGLSAALGIGWNVWLRERESRALTHVPPPAGAPSILLLILDTVRARDLSVYGYHLPTTPTLDSVAGAAIRFDQAISTAPWTLPSHASIFTGRYPHELSAKWYAPLDGSQPTLAERLTRAGYATGGFVGNLVYTEYLYGLNRGFLRYVDYPLSVPQLLTASTLTRSVLDWWRRVRHRLRDSQHKDGRLVTDEFLAWQRGLGGRPFFAFLNYFDAHAPYQPPAPFDTMFLGREPGLRAPNLRRYPDQEGIRDLRRAYDGGIRYVDMQIDRVLTELERRGVLENTLVIITGDHGEEFGEHGVLGHGGNVLLTQVHVPLLIVLPGRTVRNVVIETPVTLRDLAATILDVAGVRAVPLPGRSLARFWSPEIAVRDSAVPESALISEVGEQPEFTTRYPSARGDLRSIIRDGWHYWESTSGEQGLYRFPQDSLEQHNLVTDPALASTVATLRDVLERERRP